MADGARAARSSDGWCSWAMALAALGVLAGVLLPWVASGSSWRSSFAALRSARRVGLADSAAAESLAVLWVAVPVGIGLLLVGLASGRPRAAVAAGLVVGVVAGSVAAIALLAPVPRGPGPLTTLVSAGVLLVACVAAVRAPRPLTSSLESG